MLEFVILPVFSVNNLFNNLNPLLCSDTRKRSHSFTMRKKYVFITVLIIATILFLLISQTTLDLLHENQVSLPNPSIYGAGCGKNPFRERFEILLRTWLSIAARRNITYFICYGSLLGLFRDGEPIPFDHDMDVCIFRKDLYKLELEDEPKPFDPNDGNTHLIYQKHCHHPKPDTPRTSCQGVTVSKMVDQCAFLDPCARLYLKTTWLDVFAMRDKNTDLLDDWKRKTLKRDIIFPLQPCVLMGMKTLCPNDITAYLTTYYGKDYTKSLYVCVDGKWTTNGPNVKKNVKPQVKRIDVPHCPEKDILCKVKTFIQRMKKKMLQ